MGYLVIATIVIFIFFIVSLAQRKKRQKIIFQIQSAWANPKTEYFDFSKISNYADVTEKNEFHHLTEQTIEDIDLFGLFKFIDRTTSKVGQQFLYKKIIEPSNETQDYSEKFIELFSADKRLREEIQLELLKLSSPDAYYIPTLLKGGLLTKPKWFNLLKIDIAVVVSLVILSLKFYFFLIALIVPFAVNMFLHFWNKNNTFQFGRSIPQLNSLINIAKTLSSKNELLRNKEVEGSISKLRSFQQKSFLIKFDFQSSIQDGISQILFYLLDLVKAFFLVEIFTLFKIVKELEQKQSSIITLFNYVGNIDSSISVASLRNGKLKTCQPVFISTGKEFTIKGAYHPLIDNCVKNDLSVNNRSILITGSNMSGKSTFLRTVILNSVLAQTIYTCFADEFSTAILKQYSSIKINDNLFEGKSYYFQEVSIMASLLKEAKSQFQNLFILDEVFKGTNTIERIASAKAILSYLNQNNNIVMVATHDIELADMLNGEYDLYHFTETIENNELHFDHKIRMGQLKTRNAIKLLELLKYPSEIVNEAQQISSLLVTKTIGRKISD